MNKNLEELHPKVKEHLIAAARIMVAQNAGRHTSPKKAKSSARNGKLGGRPRKLAAA